MTTTKDNSQLLREMMEIQNRLNTFLDADWFTKREVYQNRIAIFDECSEIVNAMNWKWWSKAKKNLDIKQIQLEVVDIWMFMLSEIRFAIERNYQGLSRDEVLTAVTYHLGKPEDYDTTCLLNEVGETTPESENFMVHSAMRLAAVFAKPGYDAWEHMGWYLPYFAELLKQVGMTFEDLYKLYSQKAALNLLRWENGYGTTYQKTWKYWSASCYAPPYSDPAQIEDNVALIKIVEKFPDLDTEGLLNKLRQVYKLQLEDKFAVGWEELVT